MRPTIAIDRDTRNALHKQVQYDAEETAKIGFALQLGDRGTACGMLGRATYWRDLLDVIGWTEEDDRDSYEIPAEGPLREWLDAALSDMRKIVGDDRAMLLSYQKERSGRHAYIECSQEESIEKTTALVDQQERHIRNLLGVLEQLDDSGWGVGNTTSARSGGKLSGAMQESRI